MIILFKLKNHLSFINETILTMQSVSFKEHQSHLIPISTYKLNKTMAIYGSNASGKSNLIYSILSFQNFIYKQLTIADTPNTNMGSFGSSLYSTTREDLGDTEFELAFYNEGQVFQYGFSFYNNTVYSERLTIDRNLVFSRTATHLNLGCQYKKELAAYKSPREDCLYITLLNCINSRPIRSIMNTFTNFFIHKLAVLCDFSSTTKMEDLSLNISALIASLEQKEQILVILHKLNIGIDDLILVHGRVKIVYNQYDITGLRMDQKYLDISQASCGTKKILKILHLAFHFLQCGGTLIIDDLSDNLHPLVTKFIIELFQSKSNQKAQLIFTTHEISILNNQQFRRDEIAFINKSTSNHSTIYTLADLKIRSDASYSKDYLLGKYTTAPQINQ